jgi:GntP family gluconate:H+ symporter
MINTIASMPSDPLFFLFCGVLTVVGMIVLLRCNAFLSLLAAALVVSFLTPLEPGQFWNDNIKNVCTAFGTMAGRVGILIAMGAIIGKCMLDRGAADRILRFIIELFGQRLIPAAMLTGGFVISIPVFYDTTFYLLVPIVRSVYKRIRKKYTLCLMAVGLGATLSHTLIPPTPGPVIVAETLQVPLGTMMLVALMVGALTAIPALLIAFLMDWVLPNPAVHFEDELTTDSGDNPGANAPGSCNPSLFWSFAPIVVPVGLIAMQTTVGMLEKTGQIVWSKDFLFIQNFLRLLGDPWFALILAAVIAMSVLMRTRKLSFESLGKHVESALLGAGMIILITAAGGAFGETLRQSGIGERLQELCQGEGGTGMTGLGLLLLAFGTAAIIKTAQGSSTTAIITTAGIFAGILNAPDAPPLPFNTAYLAVSIGLGSCVTGWMNDSGFWLFCRMGGIKEMDALKTWTVGLVLLGLSGRFVVVMLSLFLPLPTLP